MTKTRVFPILSCLASVRLVWLSLCLVVLAAPPVGAAETERSPNVEIRWEMARDPGGRRTQQEMAQQTFEPVSGPLALGFTADAVWLRFMLSQDATMPTPWWLVTSPPFLEHLDLYAPQNDAAGYRLVPGGALTPPEKRAIGLRETAFPLILDATPRTYYLRLQSKTTIALEAHLVAPRDFAAQAMLQNTRHGVFLGLLVSSALISLLCALWLRETFFFVATTYLVFLGLNYLSLNGYEKYLLGLQWPELLTSNLLPPAGFYGCMLAALHGLFVLSYMQARRYFPGLHRSLQMIVVLCLVCAAGALAGYWDRIGGWFYSLVLLLIALMVGLFIAMQPHRPARARLMLIMFMPGLLAVVLQSARNIGLLPLNFWTTDLWGWTFFFQVPFSAVVVLLRVRETYQRAADVRARERVQRSLIDMMAHELRTPLAVVGTAVANLEARTLPGQPDLQPRYQRLRTALDRLNTVVDNALGQQRLSNPDMRFHLQPTSPGALLEQARGLAIQDDRHPVQWSLAGDDTPLPMDLHWVALAVVNLIDNAIKYSPMGGPVVVHIERTADSLHIRVSDTGMGIPPKALASVFERFYRAPNALGLTTTTGMGLGLFLVQQVAQGHGGRVQAENLAGGGSRFSMTLAA